MFNSLFFLLNFRYFVSVWFHRRYSLEALCWRRCNIFFGHVWYYSATRKKNHKNFIVDNSTILYLYNKMIARMRRNVFWLKNKLGLLLISLWGSRPVQEIFDHSSFTIEFYSSKSWSSVERFFIWKIHVGAKSHKGYFYICVFTVKFIIFTSRCHLQIQS